MRKMTDENVSPIGTPMERAPRKHVSAKIAHGHKRKPKASKKAAQRVTGSGKFERKCALKSCRKPFRTDDERKIYHSRACGNKERSKRWYQAAAEALRSLRKKKS
jgi:hypothetical protein